MATRYAELFAISMTQLRGQMKYARSILTARERFFVVHYRFRADKPKCTHVKHHCPINANLSMSISKAFKERRCSHSPHQSSVDQTIITIQPVSQVTLARPTQLRAQMEISEVQHLPARIKIQITIKVVLTLTLILAS